MYPNPYFPVVIESVRFELPSHSILGPKDQKPHFLQPAHDDFGYILSCTHLPTQRHIHIRGVGTYPEFLNTTSKLIYIGACPFTSHEDVFLDVSAAQTQYKGGIYIRMDHNSNSTKQYKRNRSFKRTPVNAVPIREDNLWNCLAFTILSLILR
jgi:hypothetical protein